MQTRMFPPSIKIDVKSKKTCRSCKHRQRWECGSRYFQYCGILTSNRTRNGQLKIKVTKEACIHYEI